MKQAIVLLIAILTLVALGVACQATVTLVPQPPDLPFADEFDQTRSPAPQFVATPMAIPKLWGSSPVPTASLSLAATPTPGSLIPKIIRESSLTPVPTVTPALRRAQASTERSRSDTAPTPTPKPAPSPTVTSVPGRQLALVTRVIDGDTIEVELVPSAKPFDGTQDKPIEGIEGQRLKVRYIGIDTPETRHPRKPVECFGHQATEKNREMVEGKVVELEKDISETDRYGRLLRYVYVDGLFVNAELVRLGYAQLATYPPDVRYAHLFLQLQQEAREARRGLWGNCQ